jgi:hypothetical protein
MQDNDSASLEVSSPTPIYVNEINPLIQPTGLIDTVDHVKAVLSTLSYLSAGDGVDAKHFDLGLTLIHEWLERSLTFAMDYPRVTEVMPAASET